MYRNKISLYVDICSAPTLDGDKQPILYQYLQDVSNNLVFSSAVIQVLTEDFKQAHQYWWNENKTSDPFQVGNIFKAHVQVNSNTKK